jgi:hypothetical protein
MSAIPAERKVLNIAVLETDAPDEGGKLRESYGTYSKLKLICEIILIINKSTQLFAILCSNLLTQPTILIFFRHSNNL